MFERKEWNRFVADVKGWYHPEKRRLPWKEHSDAYHVWVSEVFLQQTQAERVVDFFIRFTAQFPTVESLSVATFEEALPYFRGLGFYGRLRRMIKTAQAIVVKYDGVFPVSIKDLESLPGIGPYTARAIASFAYGEKCIAPDTNVVRILGRYFGLGWPDMNVHYTRGEQETEIWDEMLMRKRVMSSLEVIDEQFPSDLNLNQALMDLGAMVCFSREPKCRECPLQKKCVYVNTNIRNLNGTMRRNSRKHRSLRGYQKVVCGVLIHEGRILVTRRRVDQTYSGKLEFPGGKVEVDEDERQALRREFKEELGVDISVRPAFDTAVNEWYKCKLSFHRCRILTGDPRPLEGQEMLWLRQDELSTCEFVPANKQVVEKVKVSRL
jgi:A/G-specific adenine glycosylase